MNSPSFFFIFIRSVRPIHSKCATKALYSSTATNPASVPTGKKRFRRYHIIDTLMVDKLTHRNYLDLRHSKRPTVKALLKDPHHPPVKSTLCYEAARGPPTRLPWPENARGFFYFLRNPAGTDFAASTIRFRVTPTSDPADFLNGYDLLNSSGTPWFIPMLNLVYKRSYAGFRELLADEGILNPELLRKLQKITEQFNTQYGYNTHYKYTNFLFSFDQPFVVRFNQKSSQFYALKNEKVVGGRLDSIFRDGRQSARLHPYKGAALVRFELTPDSVPGRRRVQLRFLRIMSLEMANDYDGHIILPKEGELLARRFAKGVSPWGIAVEKDNGTVASMVRHLLDWNQEDS